jgi:hypothetical protein
MNKFRKYLQGDIMKLYLVVMCLVFSFSSMAQTRVVSIDAFDYSYSGGLSFKHDEGKGSTDDKDSTTFKFNLNYAQNWPEYVGVMWKAQAYWNRESVDQRSNDTLNSTFGVVGGVLYNFNPDNMKNSFMVGAGLGIERQTIEESSGNDESGFNFSLNFEGGKRWDLGSYSSANISYAPTVSFHWKRYGGGIRDDLYTSSRDLRFNFLKFDILF